MILKSKCLKNGDIHIPAKKKMIIYSEAVSTAKSQDKWLKHPNKKRNTQKIQLVRNLGAAWKSSAPSGDVDLCACVVQ